MQPVHVSQCFNIIKGSVGEVVEMLQKIGAFCNPARIEPGFNPGALDPEVNNLKREVGRLCQLIQEYLCMVDDEKYQLASEVFYLQELGKIVQGPLAQEILMNLQTAICRTDTDQVKKFERVASDLIYSMNNQEFAYIHQKLNFEKMYQKSNNQDVACSIFHGPEYVASAREVLGDLMSLTEPFIFTKDCLGDVWIRFVPLTGETPLIDPGQFNVFLEGIMEKSKEFMVTKSKLGKLLNSSPSIPGNLYKTCSYYIKKMNELMTGSEMKMCILHTTQINWSHGRATENHF